jgi:diadenosine tetraphosphate (Ap4A) HIT family hydrolase
MNKTLKFELHPTLERDTTHIVDLPLCRVLLMEDARFPWLILVPRQHGLREFHDVTGQDAMQLHNEIALTSQVLLDLTGAYKINVAALGNMVPQLHVHVIARNQDDEAWPGPVWQTGPARPYTDKVRAGRAALLQEAIAEATAQ